MQYISIEGRRDAYGADDLAEQTVTVGELIDILSQFDEDLPVIINNDEGYTYGKIKNWTIEEAEYNSEW